MQAVAFIIFVAGVLKPSTIVRAPYGSRLLANLICRTPTVVEEHENRGNAVFLSDTQICLHPCLKALGVLLPSSMMKKDTHTIQAQILSPAKFAVDNLRRKRVGLPHFELIDSIRRNEIATSQPTMLLRPAISPFDAPLWSSHCRESA